jgi:hypothetical protein
MAEVRRGCSLCPHMASSKLKPETAVKAGMLNKVPKQMNSQFTVITLVAHHVNVAQKVGSNGD